MRSNYAICTSLIVHTVFRLRGRKGHALSLQNRYELTDKSEFVGIILYYIFYRKLGKLSIRILVAI